MGPREPSLVTSEDRLRDPCVKVVSTLRVVRRTLPVSFTHREHTEEYSVNETPLYF